MIDEVQLMKSFCDSSDAVIYVKDAQGAFVYINKKGAELAGMKREDIIGKTNYEIVSKEEADRVTKIEEDVRKTGMPINFKDTLNLPSGKITVLDHKFPISSIDHKGAIGGIAILIPE